MVASSVAVVSIIVSVIVSAVISSAVSAVIVIGFAWVWAPVDLVCWVAVASSAI